MQEQQKTADSKAQKQLENAPPNDKSLLCWQLVSYAIFALLSVYFFIVAGDLPSSKWEPLGASSFPKIILVMIGALSVLAFIADGKRFMSLKKVAMNMNWDKSQNKVVMLFVILIVYLVLTPVLGFKISTFVFLLITQLALGPKTKNNLIISLLISAIFAIGIFYLFANVFDIYLPRAVWS